MGLHLRRANLLHRRKKSAIPLISHRSETCFQSSKFVYFHSKKLAKFLSNRKVDLMHKLKEVDFSQLFPCVYFAD
jgi:hypothetical protein